MKKRNLIILLGCIILISGLTFSLPSQHKSATPPAIQPSSQSTTTKHKVIRPLTVTELNHNSQLREACIIYFAIKYTKLPRWQELSDFKLGWQVERYLKHNPDKYLVWPDENITTAEKNLEPNWFKLTTDGKVTYDSMIVHSFRQDQTATTTLPKIVHRLNAERKMTTVRRLSHNLSQLIHKTK
ncbi:hypothetical protein [Levilactobacillus fujinensis]|uniref:Uncharacterized protein n=1 Tax=Levilactobacillus fujinensis TaxID=2486024 RepID=A0ABW1TJR0_9LACO|nr:hypothetical protein [Levilactobacillus fujinensis]